MSSGVLGRRKSGRTKTSGDFLRRATLRPVGMTIFPSLSRSCLENELSTRPKKSWASGPPEEMKNCHSCFLPFLTEKEVSSRLERTRISCHASLDRPRVRLSLSQPWTKKWPFLAERPPVFEPTILSVYRDKYDVIPGSAARGWSGDPVSSNGR